MNSYTSNIAASEDVVVKALSELNSSSSSSSSSNHRPSTTMEQNNSNKAANEHKQKHSNKESEEVQHVIKTRKPRFKRIEYKYPVDPRVIQVVKKPKTYTDHSYRDFSCVPPEIGYVHPTKIEDMTFAQKVFHMLSDETISNWIHWLSHGRAFKIAVPKRLEQSQTLQRYFGHNRYSSFLRQLNNHGFKHLTKGPDRNCYYHECMLRGMPHLTKYMPPGRDARRLMADPDNEPDFYQIDRLFPLGNHKATTTTPGNPFLGFGMQNPCPSLLGTGNFQQLPPGFLSNNMNTNTPPPIAPQINMNVGNNNMLNPMSAMALAQQVTTNANTNSNNMNNVSQPPMHDPNMLAALLQQQQQQQQTQLFQQQQQQQQQSMQQQQRAQSSLMRFM